MAIDHLREVPKEWVEAHMDELSEVYNKIKDHFWVQWQGGYVWYFGINKPKGNPRYHTEIKHPTLEMVIERAAIFAGVHKTTRMPKYGEGTNAS